MPTLALATCADHPRLYADDIPLVRALAARGVRAVPAIWHDPPPPGIDAWMIRSTWDYHLRTGEFLAFVDREGSAHPMWNAPSLLRWNSHKTYLRDLASRGVRVVPTVWSDRVAPEALSAEIDARTWTDVVVKPAVSASAHRTTRYAPRDRDAAREHFAALAATGTAMVQPYLASVETYGERSFFYMDGEYTHAVQRQAVLSAGFESERPAPLVDPSHAERSLCEATLAALDTPPLYARIDIAPDADGVPHLMELELIEPRLYFREAPHAAERIADALATRLSEAVS